MSQIFRSYDFLLALKAGEINVLAQRDIDDPQPLAQKPIYQQAYTAIKRLNYNQAGKFELVLRTSRDGLTLAAICTFDGEDHAEIPDEFKRSYRTRKKKKPEPPRSDPNFKPLSYFMREHHLGRAVEVKVNGKWVPVEAEHWTSVKPENFRSRKRNVVRFRAEGSREWFIRYDESKEEIEKLRRDYKEVIVYIEED